MKEFLIKALGRAGLLKAVNFALAIRVGGSRIRVPFVQGVGFTRSDEPWMRRLLEYFLGRTPNAVIDVGVNLGQTLALVKSVDPARPYLGFEPNPVCVAYAHDLIALNRFEHCTIVPAALCREDRVLHLNLYQNYRADGTATIVENFRAPRPVAQQMCVAAYRYATVAAHLPPVAVGVVKIDVEGAELDVLLSLQDAILQHRPVVLVEVLPVYATENTDRKRRQEELEALLREWQYVLLRVKKDGKRFAGLEEVDRIGIHGDLTRCDYVSVPRQDRDRVLADMASG